MTEDQVTGRSVLRVIAAGPHVSTQDGGRPGYARYGVPTSGPMDGFSHAVANVGVGNDPAATAIEASLGGVVLECIEGETLVAVTGGGFVGNSDSWALVALERGDHLEVRPGSWGTWSYVAVAGEIEAPHWLGSSATHSFSNRGGVALRPGVELEVRNSRCDHSLVGPLEVPDLARPSGICRVLAGSQMSYFEEGAFGAFLAAEFTLTDAYDRMGVRLGGPAIGLRDALTIPSEPVAMGSIQVDGSGVPTVLLADHQTTGGYPKLATAIAADLGRLAQLRPGDAIRFREVDPDEAVEFTRTVYSQRKDYLGAVVDRAPTLAANLLRHNLIDWGEAD